MVGLDKDSEVLADEWRKNKCPVLGLTLVIGTGGAADAGNKFSVYNNLRRVGVAERDIKGGVVLKRNGCGGGSGPKAAGKKSRCQ